MARELRIATGEKVVHNNVAYVITSVIDEKNVVVLIPILCWPEG